MSTSQPPAQPPQVPLPQAPEEIISVRFADRLREIRQEVKAETPKTPEPVSVAWWKRFRNYVPILLILVWLAVSSYMFFNPQAGRSIFILSDIRITGPVDLCPSDKLKFEFDVDMRSVGVYSLYMSTWKVDPPPSTIIFSETQPFVVGSVRNFPILREWEIPSTYEDPANELTVPMIPGRYIRDISVVATGKNTESTPLQVNFTVREDCP